MFNILVATVIPLYSQGNLTKSVSNLQINQTGTYGRGGRTNIAVPAQGIVDIRDALSEVLEQYGSDEGMSFVYPYNSYRSRK